VTCRELVQFLGDYLDGDLSAEVRRRFDAHLAACPDCVAYLDGYRQLVRLNRSLGREVAPHMPENLVRAILAARASVGDPGA
jgi:anti-sigma factor RsiW